MKDNNIPVPESKSESRDIIKELLAVLSDLPVSKAKHYISELLEFEIDKNSKVNPTAHEL